MAAEGLRMLVERLEPQDAAAAAALTSAADRLIKALGETKNPQALLQLASALGAVSGRLGPRSAAAAAAVLTTGMAQIPQIQRSQISTYPRSRDALRSILAGLSSPQRQRRAAAAAADVAHAAGAVPFAIPAVLAPLEPLPAGLPTPELVELLKHPLCVGEARRIVLDRLGYHYGRKFADQWEFVRFAKEQKLPLDLTSPPKRPEPTAPAAGK